MRYALNLAGDGRILSATVERFRLPGQPLTETLPEGNIADWRYVNGAYVYDPLPPQAREMSTAERIAQLEEALSLLLSGVTE